MNVGFFRLFVCFFMISLIPAGCGGGPSVIRTPANQFVNIELADSSLQNDLIISAVNGRINNGMLEMNVSVFNKNKADLPLKYRIKWYDDFGNQVSEGMFNWTPIIAKSSQTFTIQKRAIDKKAVSSVVVFLRQ